MQEIADDAAINKAMLHYYFRSKDKLYEEVFGYVMRRFMNALGESIRERETFRDTLRAFVECYIEFVRSHQSVVRLMVAELLAGGPVLKAQLKRIFVEAEIVTPRILLEKLSEAAARGEIRPVDPYQMLVTTVAACIFVFIAAPMITTINPALADDWDAFIEARKGHVFEVLYLGLKSRPEEE